MALDDEAPAGRATLGLDGASGISPPSPWMLRGYIRAEETDLEDVLWATLDNTFPIEPGGETEEVATGAEVSGTIYAGVLLYNPDEGVFQYGSAILTEMVPAVQEVSGPAEPDGEQIITGLVDGTRGSAIARPKAKWEKQNAEDLSCQRCS